MTKGVKIWGAFALAVALFSGSASPSVGQLTVRTGQLGRLSLPELGFYFEPLCYPNWGKTYHSWDFFGEDHALEPTAEGVCAFRIALGENGIFNGVLSATNLDERTVRVSYVLTPTVDARVERLCLLGKLPMPWFGGGTARAIWDDGGTEDWTLPGKLIPDQRQVKPYYNLRRLELYNSQRELALAFSFPELNPSEINAQFELLPNSGGYSIDCRIFPKQQEFVRDQPFTLVFDITAGERAVQAEVARLEEAQIGPDWIPVRDFLGIVPGSALDFSGMREIDAAPAGRYGQLVRVGDQFEFERRPGVSVRFFGVNLGGDGPMPPPENAEPFAEYLTRMGCNVVRLHLFEQQLTLPPARTQIDPERLDRLDRLVAACKARGIYVVTDLLSQRMPQRRALGCDGDGVIDWERFKVMVYVPGLAQDNYFEFARNLLTHVNPHTGLSLAEDPVLAGVSVVNESSFNESPEAALRKYPGWREAWDQWCTTNAPDFRRFERETRRQFTAKVRAFMAEIGCRALLSDFNKSVLLASREPLLADYDYCEAHIYYDHPVYPENCAAELNGENYLTLNGGFGVNWGVFRRWTDRPFLVSEYDYVAPNRYRMQEGLLYGALAARQGWSGLIGHAWSGAADVRAAAEPSAPIEPLWLFHIATDPVKIASQRAVVPLFVRGDMPALPKDYSKAVWVTPETLCTTNDYADWMIANVPYHWAGWITRLGINVTNEIPFGTDPRCIWPRARYLSQSEMFDLFGFSWSQVRGGMAGPVRLDGELGHLAINTPRTQGGFVTAGHELATGVFVARVECADAAVWATSLDGWPLAESRRILVSHVTDARNTGEQLHYNTPAKVAWEARGQTPQLMRAGTAAITLALGGADCRDRFEVYALTGDGRRAARLAAVIGGPVEFTADIGRNPDCATFHYEIVRIGQ